ncbi:transposase IS200 family protein [Pedobacter psychrotolerans]|uniref:Transposase n=1 Tax=Pedobacter psychrotolerans TaxID=1843235 RepID=A0A4R2H9A3_9SPHI|nr:transposase [Pedobacter psychrotolerans]TCO23597.1 transposase IS200 family protein [Pedobacter psychrotolerans]GGE61102.1 transposase [Pedobacter psychrotolerans]
MSSGIEFFTATCLNWQNLLLEKRHKEIVLDSLKFLVKENRIWLYGYVIMPNHIHILWSKQDEWIEKSIQQQFLKYTAQQIKFNLIANFPEQLRNYKSTQADRQYHFWERRPYNATILTREIFEQKLEYVHYNPVKKGLCLESHDYEYSSARFYLMNQKNEIITHYMEHI